MRKHLTDNEIEILRLIKSGKSNVEIARDSGRAVSTIENTLQKIYTILKVKNKMEAVMLALKEGLIKL